MNAVSNFGIRVGKLVLGLQPAVHRSPCLAAVIGAKGACGRDGDVNPLRVLWIKDNRMDGHAACAGLPEMAFGVAQTWKFLPRFAAVHRLEQGGVFRAGIDGVRIGQRRFEMPDALEFPRVLRAVVPLVSTHLALIHKFVAFTFGHAVRAN